MATVKRAVYFQVDFLEGRCEKLHRQKLTMRKAQKLKMKTRKINFCEKECKQD